MRSAERYGQRCQIRAICVADRGIGLGGDRDRATIRPKRTVAHARGRPIQIDHGRVQINRNGRGSRRACKCAIACRQLDELVRHSRTTICIVIGNGAQHLLIVGRRVATDKAQRGVIKARGNVGSARVSGQLISGARAIEHGS